MHSIESIIYPKKSSSPGYFHPTKWHTPTT
jgi:hypothetical protein